MMALQAVPGIVQGFTDKNRLDKDFQTEKDRLKLLGGQEATEKAARTYGVGEGWNKFLAASKQDKAADLQRDIASEQEATAVNTLTAGGAKSILGGLGASQRQAAQQRMGIEADSAARQQAALGQYAAVEQRADEGNVRLAATDLARTQGLKDEATLRKEALRGEKRGNKDDMMNTVMGLGGDLLLGGLSGAGGLLGAITADKGARVERRTTRNKAIADQAVKDGRTTLGGRLLGSTSNDDVRDGWQEAVARERGQGYKSIYNRVQPSSSSQPSSGEGTYTADEVRGMLEGLDNSPNDLGLEGELPIGLGSAEATVPFEASHTFGGTTSALGGNMGAFGTRVRLRQTTPRSNAQGGTIEKTPGEFSHDTNEMYLVDNKGNDVGINMTGGETVFNPSQTAKMEALSSKGNTKLHKFLRDLFRKFDKKNDEA